MRIFSKDDNDPLVTVWILIAAPIIGMGIGFLVGWWLL